MPHPVILLATRNPKKLAELRTFLRGLRARCVTPAAYPALRPVREDGATFEANAIKKALAPSRCVPVIVVAEDSGLVVPALGGAPGVRSARFTSGRRYRGRGLDRDAANNARILRLLRGVPPARRRAAFVCVVAVARQGRLMGIAHGVCWGRLALGPRGAAGFGYDPLFIPRGHRRTFAELGAPVKARISHRARALARARPLIARVLRTDPGAARTPALSTPD